MRGFIGIIGLGLFLLLTSSCSQFEKRYQPSDNYTAGSFGRGVARNVGTDVAVHLAVSILGGLLTSRPKETTPKYELENLKTGPNKLALCRAAMDRAGDRWDMRPAYKDSVRDAENAGLTEQNCRDILHGFLKAKPSIDSTGTPKKLALCRAAMNRASGRWRMRPAYKDFVIDAKNAGLTEDKCLNILADTP